MIQICPAEVFHIVKKRDLRHRIGYELSAAVRMHLRFNTVAGNIHDIDTYVLCQHDVQKPVFQSFFHTYRLLRAFPSLTTSIHQYAENKNKTRDKTDRPPAVRTNPSFVLPVLYGTILFIESAAGSRRSGTSRQSFHTRQLRKSVLHGNCVNIQTASAPRTSNIHSRCGESFAKIVNSLRSDSTVFAHSTSFVHEEVLRLVQIV